jgi:hypothetical protein
MKSGLKELGVKCRDYEKRWNALEREQDKAYDRIYKVTELRSKLQSALDQEQDKKKQKREAARYCNHCNKIKPQAPTSCHCKP